MATEYSLDPAVVRDWTWERKVFEYHALREFKSFQQEQFGTVDAQIDADVSDATPSSLTSRQKPHVTRDVAKHGTVIST